MCAREASPKQLLGVVGSRNWDVRPFQVGVSEGERAAKGGLDREAEEIADPSNVTAGGVDLLKDAVFTQNEDHLPAGVLGGATMSIT
jgi:hypothetical protein